MCAPVDIEARIRDARLHVQRGTERERSHVDAVARHVAGDSAPLVQHLRRHPTDALLLSVAVPTIAFAGVTTVPQDAWDIVERCAPAYGDDWWFAGLLAFMRQEQGRFDEAMTLACLSLDTEPGAGHSAHARAHAHYETGDHPGGLAWMDGWITGAGAQVDSLSHFSWHAALHELSLGDLDAVRVRYESQLRPEAGMGCRSLVDSGSLLWRWTLTPGSSAVPGMARGARRWSTRRCCTVRRRRSSRCTPRSCSAPRRTPRAWPRWPGPAPSARRWRTPRSPLPWRSRCAAWCSGTRPGPPTTSAPCSRSLWRVGGSDAQREVVEETRICALVRAARYAEALTLIDRRLDRRRCRRDEWFQTQAQLTEIWSPSTDTFLG